MNKKSINTSEYREPIFFRWLFGTHGDFLFFTSKKKPISEPPSPFLSILKSGMKNKRKNTSESFAAPCYRGSKGRYSDFLFWTCNPLLGFQNFDSGPCTAFSSCLQKLQLLRNNYKLPKFLPEGRDCITYTLRAKIWHFYMILNR